MRGIPAIITPDIEQQILELVSQGATWKKISEAVGLSVSVMFNYRRKNNEFNELVNQAQEMGFEIDADKLKTAHDDIADPLKARLFSENTRWLLARRAAHRYGDRLDITTNRTIDIGRALQEARARAGMLIEPVGDDAIETVAKKVEEIAGPENAGGELGGEEIGLGNVETIDDLL